MKRSNITRKTPIKRGKNPMAKKSKTNSKPFQNEALQNDYRKKHQHCELLSWFCINYPQLPVVFTGLDLHHIRQGKHDAWPNFIRACRCIHEFDKQHPKEMFVVCLWHKWRKGGKDWNLKVLDECGNGTVLGELERCKPQLKAFLPLWQELMTVLGD